MRVAVAVPTRPFTVHWKFLTSLYELEGFPYCVGYASRTLPESMGIEVPEGKRGVIRTLFYDDMDLGTIL